jgi:ankyrin repeat protein
MNAVPCTLKKLSSPVKRFGFCLSLWLVLWPGLGAPVGSAVPQGDAPTEVIYERAAAEALRRRDEALVEAFRTRKVEIKAPGNSTGSADPTAYAEALIRAAGRDDLDLVKMLLVRGADIAHRSEGNSKATAMLAAVGNCRAKMVAFLAERGAPLDERSSGTGAPLLHTAAGVGCTELVEWLLARGADVRARNAFGDSTLYAAAGRSKHSAKIVELLLKSGAEPDVQNNLGYTPLMQAATAPRTTEDEVTAIEVIKLLRASGASLDTQTFDYGDTALIWAIKLRHTRVAEFLITQGADVTLKDREGRDALRHARDQRSKELELLLQARQP